MVRSTARAAAPIPRTWDQEDGRDRRRRGLSPCRPRARGHRRLCPPAGRRIWPRRAGQVGVGVGDREHRGHHRRSHATRPTAATGTRPAAGLPRGRKAADHRHRGPGRSDAASRCWSCSTYIHVSGYIGKAAAALHPGDPAAAGHGPTAAARVLHGRAKAVAADPRRRRRQDPRRTPAPATSTSPTWTRPSPTWRTTASTCATTRPLRKAGRSPPG